MRVLHTSDWHLGHALHELPRDREHAAFVAWLLDVIEAEAIDAVLVTGDVFDAGNPPAGALATWFGFLAEVHRRRPTATVVAIAGNHDSPARLTAPAAVLAGVRAHVVGTLPRDPDGGLDADRLLVPLTDDAGVVRAWAAAVPFLRPGELDLGGPGEATRAVFAAAVAAAQARRTPEQAIVVLGHLHLTAGALVGSERAIGGVEALAAGDLGEQVAYVALGHLHRAQRIGADHVRYAGSPIPLAMGEAGYRHQVVVIELAGPRVSEIRTLEVPRAVELVRVPPRGAAPPAEVLATLAGLPPLDPTVPPELRPFLEVAVALDAPAPRLHAQVEAAVRDRHVRLVKLGAEPVGDRQPLAATPPPEALAQLDPREVLRRRWHSVHGGEVPAPVAAAFAQLLREVNEAPS